MNIIYRIFDTFSSFEPEVLECYQNKLPKSIQVAAFYDKEKNKWWARIFVDEKNVLFTEARDRQQLEANVNEAVGCHYGIPRPYISHLLVSKNYYRDPNLADKRLLKTA